MENDYISLGINFAKEGNYNEAIRCFRLVLSDDPKNSIAYNNMGLAFQGLNNHDEAIICFKKAADISQNYGAAYSNTGTSYLHKRQPDEAIKWFQKALALNPRDYTVLNNTGVTFCELGNFDEALKCFNNSLLINPEYFRAHFNMGDVYEKMHDYTEALKCYEKTLISNPNNNIVQKKINELKVLARAQSFFQSGNSKFSRYNYSSAIEDYKESLKLDPNNSEVYTKMGFAYALLKNFREALKCHSKAYEIEPNSNITSCNIANAYSDLGDHEKALGIYQKLARLTPSHGMYSNIGSTYYKMNNYEGAIKAFKKAIELDPSFHYVSKTYFFLGAAYESMGNYTNALDSYRKSFEIDPDDIVRDKISEVQEKITNDDHITVHQKVNTPISIKIGDLIWTTCNLDVSKFRNGDLIMEAKSGQEWTLAGERHLPAWCHYNNNIGTGKRYGKLYNWHAVNDPRGLAPEGWHIPTKEELTQFIRFVEFCGRFALMPQERECAINDSGINKSGFSAMLAGYRTSEGVFLEEGSSTGFWSSMDALESLPIKNKSVSKSWFWFKKPNPSPAAHCLRLKWLELDDGYSDDYNGIGLSSSPKGIGYSIRCIKNAPFD